LNHFFVVPDGDTYRALAESEFLRKSFAVTETRTTVRADSTYSGLYLYGEHTCLEFLWAIDDRSIGIGDSGVAFGVEEHGALQHISEALPLEFPAKLSEISRELDGRPVPWFLMASPRSLPYKGSTGFSFWLMEYDSRFLAEWHSSSAGTMQSITRHGVLARYAATLREKPADPCFRDIVGLTVALEESQITFFTALCKSFGFGVGVAGDMTVLQGPAFELRLIPEESRSRGILEATLRLNHRPAQPREHRFGTTVLNVLPDGTAKWVFNSQLGVSK